MPNSELNWRFDNSYARLPAVLFSQLGPTPVRQPTLIVFNHALAAALGLAADGVPDATLAVLFGGNAVPDGALPIAQAYAGHQFGHFTMLGDGRAIALGEHIAPDGRRFDIQFKGSGPTPYSRRGDGRAALGPMLREYVISEAMQALGIPTTRSLAVVATGEPVHREETLPGAVLTRVAASHLRVGTFEFAATLRDGVTLRALVDHAIERHYPDCRAEPVPALALLRAVAARQADLIVAWMRVGFVHGVMNTDNMTISGETIDYGPCAFLDAYDPAMAFSSIDHNRRYAFGNQPRMAQWNLARFAEALLPLIHTDQDKAVDLAEAELLAFQDIYETRWLAMMRRKLGLVGDAAEDGALVNDLLSWMRAQGADYTNTFRLFASGTVAATGPFSDAAFRDWHARWQARRAQNNRPMAAARALMQQANPAYIPRNHLVEAALQAATENGDLQPFHALLDVLAQPYVERDGLARYTEANPAPDDYQTFCGT
jgi:uncharacterized protein YdiU (UPF0061 family)